MDKLSAMEVFVTVVESGSQSAAAEKLNLSRPVVSRYLAELEHWSGTRLLHRTTRKLSLTAAGSEMLTRCRQILEMTSEMQAVLSPAESQPHGLLRITTSSSFAQVQIMQAITDYVKQYPEVNVELLLFDHTVDLIDERIDLAIRITNHLDPNLIARKLTVCGSVVCASPAYLREYGTPVSGEDLATHHCLTHAYHGKSEWQFEHHGELKTFSIQSRICANEASILMQAAVAGAGVALLPTSLVAPLVRSGQLTVILPDYHALELGIYGVYTSRKHMPATLRTMLDFLVAWFAKQPSWDLV